MNANQTNWSPVATSNGTFNQRWEPNKIVPHDQNNQAANTLMGYYKDCYDRHATKGAFTIHEIVPVNHDGSLGAPLDVSLGKVLESAMEKIALNTLVCIVYK